MSKKIETIQSNHEAEEHPALFDKLLDALTPGLHVEFDPYEAMKAGAFIEDALEEEDAKESCFDETVLFVPSIDNNGVNHE